MLSLIPYQLLFHSLTTFSSTCFPLRPSPIALHLLLPSHVNHPSPLPTSLSPLPIPCSCPLLHYLPLNTYILPSLSLPHFSNPIHFLLVSGFPFPYLSFSPIPYPLPIPFLSLVPSLVHFSPIHAFSPFSSSHAPFPIPLRHHG